MAAKVRHKRCELCHRPTRMLVDWWYQHNYRWARKQVCVFCHEDMQRWSCCEQGTYPK